MVLNIDSDAIHVPVILVKEIEFAPTSPTRIAVQNRFYAWRKHCARCKEVIVSVFESYPVRIPSIPMKKLWPLLYSIFQPVIVNVAFRAVERNIGRSHLTIHPGNQAKYEEYLP